MRVNCSKNLGKAALLNCENTLDCVRPGRQNAYLRVSAPQETHRAVKPRIVRTVAAGALAQSGVAAIELLKLDWGSASVDGANAQVETTETWRTTLADGSTEDSADRNVYTLVNQAGAWKVQADEHPDSGAEVGVPSSPNVP